MINAKWLSGLSLLILALMLLTSCNRQPVGDPTPIPATAAPTAEALEPEASAIPEAPVEQDAAEPTNTPTSASPTETPTSTSIPISEADLDNSLQLVRDFLTQLSEGDYREAYGAYLTTAGQQRLADLVLGRLALANPHISFFELTGAEPAGNDIVVDVLWQEFYDGQGLVGAQPASIILNQQDGLFLIDDIKLGDYEPAATPVPPPMPRAEALTNPAMPGQEMEFHVTGFEAGETVLTWIELPGGELVEPAFQTAADQGEFSLVYDPLQTAGLPPGRWIWWAQALRNSTRNTGITFEVMPAPTATPTPTRPPVVRRPTATPAPTETPRAAYDAPVLLWPELKTSREYNSALIVEFVPVAGELAEDEFYQLVLQAKDLAGNTYGGAAIQGKGVPCSGNYSQACTSLTLFERNMRPLHPSGVEGQGSWFIQVVRQTESGEFIPISPPSESRVVILKPKP